MTVFITHCWKKRPSIPDVFWRVLLALALAAWTVQARANVELEQMRVERQEAGLLLHVHLRLDLGAKALKADFMAMESVLVPNSPARVLRSFVIEDGLKGLRGS